MKSLYNNPESELEHLNNKEKLLTEEIKELYAQESRYSNIFENSSIAIWKEDFSDVVLDLKNLPCISKQDYIEYLKKNPDTLQNIINKIKITDINDAAVKLVGADSKDHLLLSLDQLFIKESYNTFIEQFAAIATGELYYECETIGKRIDGTIFHVLMTAFYPDNPVKTAFITMVNIDDIVEKEEFQKKLLAEIEEQKKVADMLVDITFALSSKTDQTDILDIILEKVESFVSYDSANIMILKDNKLSVKGHRGYEKFNAVSFITEIETEITRMGAIKEFLINSKMQVINDTDEYDGWVKFPQTAYIKSALAAPIEWQGEIIGLLNLDSQQKFHFTKDDIDKIKILCHGAAIFLNRAILFEKIALEIEKSKNTEIILRKSLNEKDILLQEIHHRVKNNLTIIIALINLQNSKFKLPEELELFEELKLRIHSIALIHEKLYENIDLTSIDFKDYTQDLMDSISAAQIYNKKITIRVNIPRNYFFNMDILIPLGLILNELIINSIKYAFGSKGGKIDITCKKTKSNFRLTISDTGRGFPKDVLSGEKRNLGLVLVDSLVEQISGTVLFKNNNGAQIIITFSLSGHLTGKIQDDG